MRENLSDTAGHASVSRQAQPARALIYVPLLRGKDSAEQKQADPAARLHEARGLAEAISLDIAGAETCAVAQPSPATLLGAGRVAEIGEKVRAEQIDLVIIDHKLTPVQQRNLEKAWQCKVIDRTALILEIFGARARSKEGALQVELAHLNYQKGRLVRSWTHLERQRGGSGFLGGPGETQIEADRRILQEKINRITRELAKTVKTRKLHRAKRKKAPYPLIALVGYTNAGKSTLFNRLTGASVPAEDMLFATLDPTLRRIKLSRAAGGSRSAAAANGEESGGKSGQMLILSDTVGFIAHLPTHLVAAFRATLEEVTEADIILHVRDMADADNPAHRQDVVEILRSLGIDTENPDKIIEVWNKADLLTEEQRLYLRQQQTSALLPCLAVSAVSGEGVDALVNLIAEKSLGKSRSQTVRLPPQEFSLLNWLYRRGAAERHEYAENGDIILNIALSAGDWRAFAALRRRLAAERQI